MKFSENSSLNKRLFIGFGLYFISSVAYGLDIFLRGQNLPLEFALQTFFIIFNLWVLLKIGKFRNWARVLFIITCLFLWLPFFPWLMIAAPGGLTYSNELILAHSQKALNLLGTLFTVYFSLYLLKPKVRVRFLERKPLPLIRVLLVLLSLVLIVIGVGIAMVGNIARDYVRFNESSFELTEKGDEWLGVLLGDQRREAEKSTGLKMPEKWGHISSVTESEKFKLVIMIPAKLKYFQLTNLLIYETGEPINLEAMLKEVDKITAEETPAPTDVDSSILAAIKTTYQEAHSWQDLIPQVERQETLTLTDGQIQVDHLRFAGFPRLAGVKTLLKYKHKTIMIFSYSEKFSMAHFMAFIRELLGLNSKIQLPA